MPREHRALGAEQESEPGAGGGVGPVSAHPSLLLSRVKGARMRGSSPTPGPGGLQVELSGKS